MKTAHRFHLLLAICHGSKRLSEARVLRGATAIACVTEERCRQKFLTMNTGGDFYVGDFPDKGCFMKNGHGYFGTGGTDEEMAADLAGVRERIWCERETDPTTYPTRSPVTKSPTMIGIDIDSSSNEPSAKPVTDEPTGQSSAKPIELVTKSPSNQSTAKPVTDSTTTKSTPTPVTDAPSLQLTTKPSISTSFQTSVPTMSPSSILSTGPSQSVLPLPITEHTIEMTSPNNDLKIPSFAPITRPSSISDNSTEIIDSQLSSHDDSIISNQLYLIVVVFVVGFLLVSMYAIKTRYGRKFAQSQMNSGDDVSVLH